MMIVLILAYSFSFVRFFIKIEEPRSRLGILSFMKHLQRQKLNKFTPFRVLVSYYFLTVAISAGLLSLPFARKVDADWSFMDAIFTAASAVSVTGLSTISLPIHLPPLEFSSNACTTGWWYRHYDHQYLFLVNHWQENWIKAETIDSNRSKPN